MKTAVINHGQRTHSKIGASQSERWINCPGSVALCETMPKPPSKQAAEKGTSNHEGGEYCLLRNIDAKKIIGKTFNGFVVDEEDAVAIQVYLDHVRDTLKENPGAELLVEKRFKLSQVHKDLYGTSDAIIRVPFKKLIVIDYKNGVVPVEVEENPQLKIYGLGAAWDSTRNEYDDYAEVELHIVQPNAPHEDGFVRCQKMEYETLLTWTKDLKKFIKRTEQPNAILKTGDHCKYCIAAPVCPAMRKEVMATAQTDFDSPSLPVIEQLSDDQIVRIIEHKKVIEGWLKNVKDYALRRMISGERIAGLKMVRGRGSKKWLSEERVRNKFGPKILTEPKIMSVAQAEKVFGKKKVEGFWKGYEGNITLAHKDDKRKAIADAKDDFDHVEWEVHDEDF